MNASFILFFAGCATLIASVAVALIGYLDHTTSAAFKAALPLFLLSIAILCTSAFLSTS